MKPQDSVGLAILGVVLGCGARSGEKKSEKAVTELLPTYLGKASLYKTRIQADSLGAVMRGRVRRVEIVGRNVQIVPDLVLAELSITAEEIEVDRRKKQLKNVGKALFTAQITEANLAKCVKGRRPDIKDLNVTLRGEFVQAKLRPQVFGYPTVPITIQGKLLTRNNGVALDFEPDAARITLVPIPKFVLDWTMEKLNPVVDLQFLHVPIRMETATVRGGSLYLTGHLEPEELEGLGLNKN
jgi:LmeA-like phospholipid-binding